jgi:DNA-directed RNA polymerase specialized sigma24 family protein
VRAPSDEPELVRAGAAGDPAALAALWDAYGPRVFAFCQRVLGSADAAADAAQDAFLLAQAELGSLVHAGGSFGTAVFRAARTTSFELVARDGAAGGARRGPAPSLSAAAARLRPQQRAGLALSGLEGLRYAEMAAVLGVGIEAIGPLLARARLRLHDELHGTALAAAAVRSPDCEDVIPLLAAAADGELGAADAGWADPHVERCPTCPRTRRAMGEAAATYAAWSPAIPPAWLGAATLAEVGVQAPAAAALGTGAVALAGAGASDAVAASGRAGGAGGGPRPRLSAALLGGSLVAAASAALALTVSGSLRQRDALSGGLRLPDATRSLRVATVPAAPVKHRAGEQQRAPRRSRATRRPDRVVFVAVRAVAPAPSASLPSGTRAVTGTAPRRPTARPKRRPPETPAPETPAPETPAPAPAPPASAPPVAPAPVTVDAPADEAPAAGSPAAVATTAQAPAATTPTPTPTTATAAPHAPAPSIPAAQTATSDHDRWRGTGSDDDDGVRPVADRDHGSGGGKGRPSCSPTQDAPRRPGRH